MVEVVSGNNWSYKCAKRKSNRHHQQTNIQFFTGRMYVLPVTQGILQWLTVTVLQVGMQC